MQLKHKINHGTVAVADELGEELLKSGLWEEVKKAPARKTAPKKTTPKKAAPKEG